MFTKLLTTVTLYHNPHFLSRYLAFIKGRLGHPKIKYLTHLHHILPKAGDFFPQYKRLTDFPWNGVHLTPREHFIAHRMLHKAFPGSSQSIAFFNMANICGKTNSRAYQDCRLHQIASLKLLHLSPSRNAKISAALTNKPKSPEHIAKLKGHQVTTETREKLRQFNTGKKASPQTRAKMSSSRIGVTRGAHTDAGKLNISKSKMGAAWYNNGTVSKLYRTKIPSGWVKGRLPWMST